MDIWNKYISPLGYQTGTDGIDTYGVNHNGFSLRDELEYQFARDKREQELMQQYNNQGITKNYPQYTTNFWGNNAANNYGFGTSNIEGNIANLPQITPLPTIDYSQPSSLLFDGKSLNWLQNGQTIKSWSAMSGNENYQSAKYMNLADNGPIPAGNWILKKRKWTKL